MVRNATVNDIPRILELLTQVLNIHAQGRPDLFIPNTTKYTTEELIDYINNNQTPLFVYEDNNEILGYAFCEIRKRLHNNNMTDITTLFIDDLCVDESYRQKHIGEAIYKHVKEYAKGIGCYHITLNVWTCNPSAIEFYKKMGLVPMEYIMEEII